ncbi:MAG: alanine--tRNA ligase [Acidobacteria bacterium RIFCSPLOWO2_02_FULL_61_28]|nr:MAG: alanine--tRNA ligase [Acidobacteria bacterium RIFCSPLOWO2_02_FULL_61_28]
MTGSEIRKKFLDYFAARGHRVVRSSSLVPANDPTLLFTNAGMNQFKDVFLGREHRDYSRAASSQKCVRAGGKHNDLENVGRTRRHHTFFEMLGNFSFGDYFKREAIEYAWELITKEYGLPVERLYFTVFEGGLGVPKDEEAAEGWRKVGAPADRVRDGGVADNFWQMGETGPCGPCSEIHYDLGPGASDPAWRDHADCAFPCECGRYVEIWNLVFMQFDRDSGGKLTPLPRPCVDTGMGLERVAAVIQGKLSNFETDLLWPLVEAGAELAGVTYGEKAETDVSLRILADHSRAAAFLIHDGVLPANDGRGYVLRKILRRAARHGKLLGLNEPFLYQLTGKVAEIMSDAYPELLESTQRVAAVVKSEEQRFAHTMTIALQEFDKAAKEAMQAIQPLAQPVFPGPLAFRLYDTFGMPLDLIQEVATERGLAVDEAGFEVEMQRQRDRARASWKGASKEVTWPLYSDVVKDKGTVIFEGYQQTTSHNCEVLGLIQDLQGTPRSRVRNLDISAGEKANVILNHTPFYAEAGGQVGDTGVLLREDTQEVVANVEDTYGPVSGLIAHKIVSRLPIRVGDRLTAIVDAEKRRATMRNHTGTHLLNAALRQVLGTHVKQAGSVVDADRLRFDFSHFASVSGDELQEIERLANAEIVRNAAVGTEVLELDQALESGALAFFGEKYPDRVRVVTVPGFSKELCGGTHVSRTGDIGLLKVTHEGSISAGVRRVEAVTGERALAEFQAVTGIVHRIAATLKTPLAEAPEMVERLIEAQRQLEKQIETLKFKTAQAQLADIEERVRTVKDVRVLALRLESLDRAQLRSMADVLRQRLKSGVVVLATVADDKVALIAALTPDLTKRLHAGKIAQAVAKRLGGTGGGRPDIAEAGGKNVNMLDSTLNEVVEIVGEML